LRSAFIQPSQKAVGAVLRSYLREWGPTPDEGASDPAIFSAL